MNRAESIVIAVITGLANRVIELELQTFPCKHPDMDSWAKAKVSITADNVLSLEVNGCCEIAERLGRRTVQAYIEMPPDVSRHEADHSQGPT